MNPLDFSQIPIIDVSGLAAEDSASQPVAAQIGSACRESGFFYAVGHGVDQSLRRRLQDLSRQFFAQPVDSKLRIAMARGGRAWRG